MKKEKTGFWCPEDINERIQAFIDEGIHQNRSRAIISLLRQALREDQAVPGALQIRVNELALQLQRTPEVIIHQCIQGILEMIDNPDLSIPLIIEEVRLRQKRTQGD